MRRKGLKSGCQEGWFLLQAREGICSLPLPVSLGCCCHSLVPSPMCVCVSCSVVSNSLWPHGLQPTWLLCPWNSPGKNTGVGCHFLFQGIFPTRGSYLHLLCLLHWQPDSLPLSHLGSPLPATMNIVFWLCCSVSRILVSRPVEPTSPAVKAWSLNH